MRHASEKTIDWCSSTSCSKSGCQSWAMGFASTLLSAKMAARGCRELRTGAKKEKVQFARKAAKTQIKNTTRPEHQAPA
jgi:CO dehydrogenase/acetyl-CoA synthase gamma subunit (corrinoid Fe-S protein)